MLVRFSENSKRAVKPPKVPLDAPLDGEETREKNPPLAMDAPQAIAARVMLRG